jgi:uncharacterized membrane protein YvbJ
VVICPRCGSENDAGSNFCHHCEVDLRQAPPGRTDSTNLQPTQRDFWDSSATEAEHAEAPRRKRSPWITGCLAAIAVMLLLCVGFFVWGLTPTGEQQLSELGTWAARQATEQAGSE